MGRGGGRGGDRDGRRGDRRGPPGAGGASQRLLLQISALEKGLSKADYPAEKTALEEMVRLLRPMRLSSLEGLDFTARGRLLTTLLRVSRQKAPEGFGSEGATPEIAPPPEAAPAEAAAEPQGTDAVAAAPAADSDAGSTVELPVVESPPAEPAVAEEAKAEAAPSAPAEAAPPSPAALFADVLQGVGRVWRAVGETERAEAAFVASGRPAPAAEAPLKEKEESSAPVEARGGRGARGERGPRGGKGAERGERGAKRRDERPAREPRPPRVPGDWKSEAQALEARGRTRDAARLHESNGSFEEAARLFEAGGDKRGLLRAALRANDGVRARALIKELKPDEVKATLEKAEAWELLMEFLVAQADFAGVAQLYERARQFDQAALAWERAGKLTLARKAFERAKDSGNAERVKGLEIRQRVEKGDRLGAATLLMAEGKKEDAVELLKELPATKAYRFLLQLKLPDEAKKLADSELETAERESKPGVKARWLEELGDVEGAAQSWEKAERPDKALPLYERAGKWAVAAALAEALGKREVAIEHYKKAGDEASATRVSSLPPPAPPPAPPASEQAQEQG